MILNRNLLRARRMELGLTSREVAREAHVSLGLVKRLEETGDAAVVQVETLTAILRALSLDLVEALASRTCATHNDDAVTAVAGLLQERGRGVMPHEIAAALGITLGEVAPALDELDRRLRQAGLRVHHNSSGASIVPTVRPDLASGSRNERLRYLSNLNSGDIALLYRAMTTKVSANSLAATANGNVSLQKLEGAGLVNVESNEVRPTAAAVAVIGM